MPPLLQGLIGATYTPFTEDGELNLNIIPRYVDFLIENGISGLYVCGSTGEGISMTAEQRRKVGEAFHRAARERVPVVIQVGANSLTTCRELAEHAESIGATAISANAPSYFKISTAEMMVDYAEAIAASAPRLPFYYYHIPGLTGASIDLIAFLEQAEERIPTLRGVKYTDQKVFEFQDCLNYRNRKFEMLWGCDEMLLSALAVGAEGGIGSTYGLLPAVYRGVLQAWRDGNLTEARKWQLRSWHYVKLMNRFGNFHAAQKALHKQFGIDLGPCRLPLKPVTDEQEKRLQGDLESLGYFEWAFPR